MILGLLFARTRYQVPHEAETERHLGNEFHQGMAYIRQNSVVSSIILMAALIGFFGLPLVQQIPALARDVLHAVNDTEQVVAARTSQLYIAQGFGALAAAFLAAYFSSARRKGVVLTLGQAVFIIGLVALGLTTHLPTALILLVLIGWGSVTQLVVMNTLVQLEIPNGLRGRVFSVYLWALQGVAPFGSLLIGALAQHWGVPLAALVGGLVSLVSIGGLHLMNPEVHRATA